MSVHVFLKEFTSQDPDSIVDGKTVYVYRKNLGEQLATENNIKADVVIPCSRFGSASRIGFRTKVKHTFRVRYN
jgi:amidophosphoribosyltransferase